ncbi:hypothetical protein GYMLUDRAFT_179526, partial [Collybiopsis luxurians FD-317 M1]
HFLFHFFEPAIAASPLLIVGLTPLLISAKLSWPFLPFTFRIIQTYAEYLGFLLLSIALYRVSPFHPLYSVPGPFLAKVSKFYGVWMTWTGRQHILVHSIHALYGPYVRVGPNDISIVDENAIKTVLGAGGLNKGQYYEARTDPNAPGNLVTLSGEKHAMRRRLWNRGMSNESLKEYEAIITKRALQLAAQLSKPENTTADLSKWLGFFTLDFMGDMAFGGGFETLIEGADRENIKPGLRFASMVSHIPWASQAIQKIPLVNRDLLTLRRFALNKATERLQSTSLKKDLWYHLRDEAGLEKEQPPLKDVISDGGLAIIAGSDTTASALSILFFLLMIHPATYEKLQKEIHDIYPSGSDVFDTSKHGQLFFLNACINEALRMYPPVPTGGPRTTGRSERVIGGRVIPAHTQIYMPPYSLHRDPHYFSSPNDFIPERWLEMEHEPVAFIPFSFGPANCAGKGLARREMLMVASLLLQRFHFTLAPEFDQISWVDNLHDYFIVTRIPLWTKIAVKK